MTHQELKHDVSFSKNSNETNNVEMDVDYLSEKFDITRHSVQSKGSAKTEFACEICKKTFTSNAYMKKYLLNIGSKKNSKDPNS